MQYLSKEIEALAKRKKTPTNSLVKKEYSCGVFQNYENEKPSIFDAHQKDT